MHDSTYSPIQLQLQFPEPETWREVPGYEGIYEVSDRGRVRTLVTRVRGYKAGAELKQTPSADGYLTVTLILDGQNRKEYAHRLVMLAFVGAPGDLDVNHKNGVKDDNRVENLEYMTRRDNIVHSLRVLGRIRGLRGEQHQDAKLTVEGVREIRRRLTTGETCHSIAKDFGVTPSAIRQIKIGRSWKHVEG